MKKILIIAGGTGGHVFPALAVARELRQQGVTVEWLGTAKGFEASLISPENIPFHAITVSGLRGKGLSRYLVAPFQLLRAFWQSYRLIKRYQPDAVLAMGGYSAGPGGMAAWVLRKRLVIHEQNAIAGLTNKILSHVATVVLTGFPETRGLKHCQYVGNPVRSDIAAISVERILHDPLHLLVLGGSQGAEIFNRTLPKALALIDAAKRPTVWHIAGKNKVDATQQHYADCNVDARIKPFVSDMAEAYAWADVVIARAGALTVAEITAAGVASVLVPYPAAVDDHQTANARFLVNQNAAILCPQSSFSVEKVASFLQEWVTNGAPLLTMGQRARTLSQPDAVNQIIQALI